MVDALLLVVWRCRLGWSRTMRTQLKSDSSAARGVRCRDAGERRVGRSHGCSPERLRAAVAVKAAACCCAVGLLGCQPAAREAEGPPPDAVPVESRTRVEFFTSDDPELLRLESLQLAEHVAAGIENRSARTALQSQVRESQAARTAGKGSEALITLPGGVVSKPSPAVAGRVLSGLRNGRYHAYGERQLAWSAAAGMLGALGRSESAGLAQRVNAAPVFLRRDVIADQDSAAPPGTVSMENACAIVRNLLVGGSSQSSRLVGEVMSAVADMEPEEPIALITMRGSERTVYLQSGAQRRVVLLGQLARAIGSLDRRLLRRVVAELLDAPFPDGREVLRRVETEWPEEQRERMRVLSEELSWRDRVIAQQSSELMALAHEIGGESGAQHR